MEAALLETDPVNLKFSHTFNGDLYGVIKAEEQGLKFALARMADGERAIMEGDRIRGADGWSSPGDKDITTALREALSHPLPGFHLGISCPCCDLSGHEYYKWKAKHTLTFSNLFANANYPFFKEWMRTLTFPSITVGCYDSCPIQVPQNVVNEPWDMAGAVQQMHKLTGTIWVAAGPASAVLIHKYWKTVPPQSRQTIIDVGGAMDFMYTGRIARGYQDSSHPNARKVCYWS